MTKTELLEEIEDIQRKYDSVIGGNEYDLLVRDDVADLIISKTTSLKAEVKDYKRLLDARGEDFKDIENRLRGHLKAETKLRVKLQAEVESLQSQLAEKENQNKMLKISVSGIDKERESLWNENEKLEQQLAKAEADKVELLEFINVHEIEPCGKTFNRDSYIFRKPAKYSLGMEKSYTVLTLEQVISEFNQLINKNGNNG